MRRFVARASGAFLFVLACGLSLPGVKVVRADTAAADAPMCRDSSAKSAPPAALKVARMRAMLAAQARAEGATDADFVPLATSGYNYRGGDPVDIAPIERELRTPKR